MHRACVLMTCLAAGVSSFLQAAERSTQDFRPPAVPLVACDPYFSVWSCADRLTDDVTKHWTGRPHRLTALVRIDGKAFRVMGNEPAELPALKQIGLRVLPTRTIYRFAGSGVQVTLTFTTPALPDDLAVFSRPVTYLTFDVRAEDNQEHRVLLYFDARPELVVNDPNQAVSCSQEKIEGLTVLRAGSQDQPVLQKKGDDLRIDWGHLYVATPQSPSTRTVHAAAKDCRERFVGQGALPPATPSAQPVAAKDAGVLALAMDLGRVGPEAVSRWLMLAYDDLFSIQYFHQNLRPYWRRDGMQADGLLRASAREYPRLRERCQAFDDELMADLIRTGGEKYAALCALAYRQTIAGNKIAADASGQPLMFPKENFSNGCIATVDVLFPQCPFYFLFSPTLTKAMLVPILDYGQSERWRFPFAPHDLGTYPHANGQVYGGGERTEENQMPVEETGNMLIMLAALTRIDGNAEFARKYWPLLTRWADYLAQQGLDPAAQLCTADMFGHMAHNADLSLKAVIALGGHAQMCEALGKPAEARKYGTLARQFAAKWQAMARDDGRTRLAFDRPGTWGMKHNLVWDRILGLNLFPESVGDAEIAWYQKVQRKYGLPCDNRTNTCLIDWALWSIAVARSQAEFESLVNPLFAYAHETPSRVPLCDWFSTDDGKQAGFQARSVVGGLYIKTLLDAPTRQKWAGRDKTKVANWAPLPAPPTILPVTPTVPDEPVAWRYTTSRPEGAWQSCDYDASSWKSGPGGFGTAGTPGAIIRAPWTTPDIWLRREVVLASARWNDPHFWVHHDEDAEIYLNGVLAAKVTGYVTQYEAVPLAPAGISALRPGKNVIAVHCHQTFGGQSIDVALVDVIREARPRLPAIKPLFDFPVRDTSVCVGGDGWYYLTGTTGHPTWWDTNEGIRLWKSKDLRNWQPLGLVWTFEKDGAWQKAFRERKTESGATVRMRAIWAPEIHYLQGTYWLAYSVNYGGTGILKSKSGKPEGPYADAKPDGPLTEGIDASLFQDDDHKVYFVFQNGQIARLRDDLSGLAEKPRLLQPAGAGHVGFEGAFLFKADGRYYLSCAEFTRNGNGALRYDCLIASSDKLDGPYGARYVAVPHGGHNMFFRDRDGRWWSTFFGNDPESPFRERPGLLRAKIAPDGRIVPTE